MSGDRPDRVQEAAEQAVELAAEVESSAEVSIDEAELAFARAALHRWVDAAKGVVVNPGLGRVTVIHENGRVSTIASADLPFAMSRPINADRD